MENGDGLKQLEHPYQVSYTFGSVLATSSERALLIDSQGNIQFELPNTQPNQNHEFAGELFHFDH